MAIPELKLKFETTGQEKAGEAFVKIRKESTETEKSINNANKEMEKVLAQINHLEKQTFKSSDGRIRNMNGTFADLNDEINKTKEMIASLEEQGIVDKNELKNIETLTTSLEKIEKNTNNASNSFENLIKTMISLSTVILLNRDLRTETIKTIMQTKEFGISVKKIFYDITKQKVEFENVKNGIKALHKDLIPLKDSYINLFNAIKKESFKGVTALKEVGLISKAVGATAIESTINITHHASKNMLGFVEASNLASLALGSLGLILIDSESKFVKFSGILALTIAALTGAVSILASYILNVFGDAMISIGNKIMAFNKMAYEVFKKNEKGLFTFQFIFAGIKREVGDSIGALEDWEQLINKISNFSAYARSDIQSAVGEALLLGKSIGLNAMQIKKMVEVSADLASITGDTLTDAVIAFGAGLQGASQSVLKYGLHLNAAGIMHSKYGKELDGTFEKLSDQEKAQYRFAAAVEQSKIIQGKASAQMETFSGIQQKIAKSYEDILAKMGESSYLTKYIMTLYSGLIGTISKLDTSILSFVGGLGDTLSIIFLLIGYVTKLALTLSLISAIIGILNILYVKLNAYIASSVVAQNYLTAASLRAGTALGVQTVAVTGLSTAFLNLGRILKATILLQLKNLLVFLTMIPMKLFIISKAILTNPLFWKLTALVGTIYLLYKAIERIEKRTQIFSKTLKALKVALFGVGDESNKTFGKISLLTKIISYATDIAIVFVTAIINGFESIVYSIIQLIKITLKLLDAIIPLTNIFGDWADKLQNVQHALDEMHATLAEEMFSAIDRLGMGWNAYADELDSVAQESEDLISINKEVKESIEDIDKALIDARVSGNKYKEAQLEIIKAQKELDSMKEATKEEIKTKELDIYEKEAQFAKDIKDTLEKTIDDNKTLKQTLVDSKEAIQAIQDKANLEIELEIKPILKEIGDIKSLGALNKDQESLVKALEEKIAGIKTQKQQEAQKQIEDLQEKANESYLNLVGTETQKVIEEYKKRTNENEKQLNDGYLTREKFAKMEEQLFQERGDKLIESLQKENSDTSQGLNDRLNIISDFYKQALIDEVQYSLEYQKIKDLQNKMEEDSQKAYANSGLDLFAEFSQKAKETIQNTFSSLRPQIDDSDLSNTLRNMELITKTTSEGMKKSLVDLTKDAGEKIQELREKGLIDDKLQKRYLNKLENMSKDSFREVLNNIDKFIREYNYKIEKTFGMTQEEIEGMKFKEMLDKQLEDAIYEFEVEIEATISGSEGLKQELEKLKDPNTFKYSIMSDTESINKSIESFREKNDLGYNSDELKSYSKDLRETLIEHQKFQDELLIKTGSFLDNIKAGADNVVDQIFGKNLFSPTMRKAMAFEAQADFEKSFMSWGNNMNTAFRNFGRFTRKFSDYERANGTLLAGVKRVFVEFPSETLNVISSSLGPIASGIKLAVTQMFSQQSWLAEVIKFFGKSKKEMSTFIAGMTDNVILLLENVIENIPYFFTVLASKLPEVLVKIVTFMFGMKFWMAVFEGAWDAIAAFAISLYEEIKNAVQKAIDGFKKEFEKVWRGLVFMIGATLLAVMIYAISQGSQNLYLMMGGIAGGLTSIILLALNGEKVFKSLSDLLFQPFYSAWKKIWAFITGTEVRIKKRMAEYQVDEEELTKAQELKDKEAVSTYVGRYGDQEFRIKDVTETDQTTKLADYANLVDDNLNDTALNFAEDISNETQSNLAEAVKLGLKYGYASFERENDFTVKVRFLNGEAIPAFAEGGFVPGTAKKKGNSYENDIVPALLSPGEFVLPREVTQNKELMANILALISGKEVKQFAEGGTIDATLLQILKQQKARGYADSIIANQTQTPVVVQTQTQTQTQDEYETFNGGPGLGGAIEEALKSGFKWLTEKLPSLLIEAFSFIGDLFSFDIDWEGLSQGFEDAWNSVKSAFKIDLPSVSEFKTFFEETGNNLLKLIEKIGNIGKDLWKELKKGFDNLLDFSGLTNTFKNLFGEKTGKKVSESVSGAGAAIATGGIAGLIASLVIAGITAAATAIAIIATETAIYAVQVATLLWNGALTAGTYVLNLITLSATYLWTSFTTLLGTMWTMVTAAWALVAPYILIGLAIGALIGVIYLLYTNWSTITKAFQDMVNFISSIAIPTLNFLKTALTNLFNFIASTASILYSGFISSVLPFFQNFFPKILTYLSQGFTTYVVPFFSKILSFFDPTKVNWGSLGDKLYGVIKSAFDKITGGLSSGAKSAGNVVVSTVKAVGSWLGFAEGGWVSGDAPYRGNNIRNDVVPAMLSPGEYVLPRSVTQNTPLMDMILSLIEGKTPIPAYEGLPQVKNNPVNANIPQKLEININETKNINIDVKSDGKVSISNDDFRRKLLPEIKASLYEDSKKGKIILSERGIEK